MLLLPGILSKIFIEVLTFHGLKGNPLAATTLLSPIVASSTDLRTPIHSLLGRLDDKTFSSTAYDTAWVGRVLATSLIACSSYPQAIDWLRRHQQLDGSWGSDIEFFHDRILCTLSAIITLA